MARARWLLLPLGAFALAACSRADLDAITGPPSGGNAAGGAASGAAGRASGGGGVSAGAGGAAGGAAGSAVGGAAGGAAGGARADCPSPALSPGNTTVNVQVGTVTRSFILHVPTAYTGKQAAPLLIDYHGIGSSAANELSSSPYPDVTDPEGVVMAFPDGLRGPIGSAWNLGPCCVADVDDLAFTRALVSKVSTLACIDSRRVYAAGVLTGGGMVFKLACEAADLFAAVAPAAFDLLEETVDDCKPSRPITEIAFRGTADPRVPYAGGPSSLVPGMPITFLGAKSTFERWSRIENCAQPALAEDANGCASYTGCDGGVEVMLCTKQGGGDEPGNARVGWSVLKRHTL